jgi:hypothetical protein
MSAWTDAVAALSLAPVGWYKFDDTSGTTLNDSSATNLDGTYASTWVKSQATLVPGDVGGTAALLNAAAAYAASGAQVQSDTFSIALTYKGTDTSAGSVMFTRGLTGSSQTRMTIGSSAHILEYGGTNSAMTWTGGAAALSNNVEHFVIVRVSPTAQSMIVDGVVVATATATKTGTELGTVFLGGNSAASLAGIYDEWLLWDGYLSDADAADLWDAWQGGSSGTTISGSQATETDTAQAGASTAGATVAGGQAAETDTAQGGSVAFGAQIVPGSTAAEADTGQSGSTTAGSVVAGDPATETDTAQAGGVATGGNVPGNQANETDVAQGGSVTTGTAVTGGLAEEADTAQSGSVVEPADSPFAGFVNLYDSTQINGAGNLVTTGTEITFLFTLPWVLLDPATTYTVTVGYINAVGDSRISLYSALAPTQVDVDNSAWETLANYSEGFGTAPGTLGETGPFEFTIGPGIEDWDAAVLAGEHYVTFQLENMEVTSITVVDASEPDEPVGTDTTNDAHKLILGGWGIATWEPAIVPTPAHLGVRDDVISAIAYGPITFDPAHPTQPIFTYSEADAPRLRQRILLRGRDVTFDRDVATPDVEFELSDLLLYGPGSLELPAVMASWEMGTDATEGFTRGPRVKVQLVDDFTDPEHPTVVATIYKGFGLNPAVSGPHLTLELGGEAQGRLTLRDAKVLFRDVLDISRLLWRELTDVGVRYLPRLGEPGLGIKTLNFGGVGKADKVQELLSRLIKKDGTQRAVLPGEDGVYRPLDKDTTTVHFSVFVDDAFTVPELSSDLAEKPRSIYPTAIAPNGHRIDGAAVGGLIATPAPPYPMDDDSNFGIGTTNEDTDSGDGVSIMINRLGSVGLLDIRDTPGGFDEDVKDALTKLQTRARLTGPVGVMTPALWRVLWDLDVTGRSARWSTIQPTAQDPSVQRYTRAASGAPIGLNPDFDSDAIDVDESIDMGTGITERQVQNWAETRVHAPDEKVWYGTITVNMGAVLAGQVEVGDTITADDLVDARLVKPGLHNLYVPNFDGGTLFGVSGAQVDGERVAYAVDTRHRPAREIWERKQVRKDTRNDPARRWLGPRQSTQSKDAVRGFISWGGVIDRDIPLAAGHNMVELVVGDYGTLARFRTHVVNEAGEGVEHHVALFGKPPSGDSITAARWADLVPTPLAENGDRPYLRRATRRALHAHGLLDSWGTHDEPAGYEGDRKTDDAELTGIEEVTDIPFVGEDGYLVRLMIYVATPAILRKGRAAWPLLEGGI